MAPMKITVDTENSYFENDEVLLSAIRRSVGMGKQLLLPPPPATITICSRSECEPHGVLKDLDESQDQTASSTDSSVGTGRLLQDDHVGTPKSHSKKHESMEHFSHMNNSNRSLNSENIKLMMDDVSSTDSPTKSRASKMMDSVSSTPRFYIEPVDEECSIPSRVSMTDEVEGAGRSYEEWMGIVRTLYESLQIADSKLAKERERRKSREQNLLKLAKELSRRNDTISNQKKLIGELKEDLAVERSEKSLLEHRLQHYVYAYGDETDNTREELEQDLIAARKLHEDACADYENRIKKMNQTHAKQCDDLCREVIEANRENIRLRQQLLDQSVNAVTVVPRTRKRKPSLKLRKNRGLCVRLLIALVILAGCAYFQSSSVISMPKLAGRDLNKILRSHDNASDTSSSLPFPVEVVEVKENTGPGEEEVTKGDHTTVAGDVDTTLEDFSEGLSEESYCTAEAVPGKKTSLRRRAGVWLRKRVAKIGSSIKKTFVKSGDGTDKMQAVLQSRRMNSL